MSVHNSGITLILGGARSGKSHYAQQLAMRSNCKVLFVATAEPLDEEMRLRIEDHRKNRPENWMTLEVPKDIASKLSSLQHDCKVIVIDCMTLLVSNIIGAAADYRSAEHEVITESNRLIACLDKIKAEVIIVSNEVGMGLVPDNELGRVYRDMLGKANQIIASKADHVYLMVAGIPLCIHPCNTDSNPQINQI